MFLKYSLIGLGSVGIVGVGGYAVYHEVSKNKKNKAAIEQYGEDAIASSDGRVTNLPVVDPSIKAEQQAASLSK